MSQETNRFEFGDYVLDTGEKILLRDGKAIPVPPKVLDLLLVLVENHGSIVAKEDLMDRLWADTYVEESNLTFSIRKLRKILGDEAQNPQFIETIPKRGYRFIAGIESQNDRSFPAALVDGNNEPSAGDKDRSALRGSTKTYLFSGGILASILVVGLGFAFWRLNSSGSPTGLPVSIERLTYNGRAEFAAISPDGKFAAYIVDDDGEQSIWLKNVATGSDVQIFPPSKGTAFHNIFFSSDGDSIYYVAGDTLYELPILGGQPNTVFEKFGAHSQFKSITPSPDGKQFAFIRPVSANESAVIIINSGGSGERVLASSQGRGIFRRSVVWSPDGEVIALISAGTPSITVIRVSDGDISSIQSPPWGVVSQIVWQPDGRGLFVLATEGRDLSSQIWRLSYPGGQAENITNDFNNYESVSLTADGGALAAVRVEQSAHIWVASRDDLASLKQLTFGIEGYDGVYGLDYLSNGNIVYEATPGEKGEIWTIGSDGGNRKLVLSGSGSSAVSPEGKYIVFRSSNDPGAEGLFRFDISSGERVRLTSGNDIWITFSPDASWIVFSRLARGTSALWKVSINGGEATQLTDLPSGYALGPAVSPDGRWIAFHWAKRDPKQLPEIAVVPFGGGEVVKAFTIPKRTTRGYSKVGVQWSEDGQAIDYTVFRDNASNIWRQPLDGSPPVQVTTFNEQQIFNFDYSPDGEKLALSRGTYARDVVLLKFAGK